MLIKKINKVYSLNDSLYLLRSLSSKNSIESINLTMTLNLISGKKKYNFVSDINLPYSINDEVNKIAVFVEDNKVNWALENGAAYAGNTTLVDLIEKNSNNLPFNLCIGTPTMLKEIQKVKDILITSKMLPTLRNGLLSQNIDSLLTNAVKGTKKLKNDKYGNLHLKIGKVSFKNEELIKNIKYVFDQVIINKPKELKLHYIKNIYISTSHSISIPIVI